MGNHTGIASIIRWIARIWGFLLLVFVVIMFGSEVVEHMSGEPKFFIDSFSDVIGLLFFPVFCLGVVIAFRWEGLGGIIIICAMVVTQIADGRLTIDLLTGLFAISGLLFLISWYLSTAQKEIR